MIILICYTALKCCNINAQKFFVSNSRMVHKCIEESYVCQNENHDDTFYYFYTMSSPENEFYNVKIEVRNSGGLDFEVEGRQEEVQKEQK